MAVSPQGVVASVDRGRCGLEMEPRKAWIRVPTPWARLEGNIGRLAIARDVRTLRGHRPQARTEVYCTEPGISRC